MPNCRSCQAPIRFAKTAQGSTMPVDAQPHTEGNLVLYHEGPALHVRVADQRDREAVRPLHRSHFATCPKASQHRKDRR